MNRHLRNALIFVALFAIGFIAARRHTPADDAATPPSPASATISAAAPSPVAQASGPSAELPPPLPPEDADEVVTSDADSPARNPNLANLKLDMGGGSISFSSPSETAAMLLLKTDDPTAMAQLGGAAEAGDPVARNILGIYYRDKNPNLPEAARWFRKAAEQGYDQAQDAFGDLLSDGKGVNKDPAEAFKWYSKAAAQGYRASQFSLGAAYYFGTGVQQDYVRAYKWWALAAAQGNKDARHDLDILTDRLAPAELAQGKAAAAAWTASHPRKSG